MPPFRFEPTPHPRHPWRGFAALLSWGKLLYSVALPTSITFIALLFLTGGCSQDRLLAQDSSGACDESAEIVLAQGLASELRALSTWGSDYAAFYVSQRELVLSRLSSTGSLLEGPFNLGTGNKIGSLQVLDVREGFRLAFGERVDSDQLLFSARVENDELSAGAQQQLAVETDNGTRPRLARSQSGQFLMAWDEFPEVKGGQLRDGRVRQPFSFEAIDRKDDLVALVAHERELWLVLRNEGSVRLEIYSDTGKHLRGGWQLDDVGIVRVLTDIEPMLVGYVRGRSVKLAAMRSDAADIEELRSFELDEELQAFQLAADPAERLALAWMTDAGAIELSFIDHPTSDEQARVDTVVEAGAVPSLSLVPTPGGALVGHQLDDPARVIVSRHCRQAR